MDKEIAAETFSIVGKTAPAEETDRIEGNARRSGEKGAPVKVLIVDPRRNGINPGAAGGVAVPVGLNAAHFAELAGGINLSGLLVEDRADALATDLQDAVVLLRSGDHSETLVHGMGERLLAIDVFAGSEGVHHDAAVLMISYRNDHGVDVLAIEDLFIVARSRNLF